eukprot:gene1095-1386_t
MSTLPIDSIPMSVTKLSLDIDFEVGFSYPFEEALEVGSIVESVERLTINHKFFKHNPQLIPSSCTDLKIIGWIYKKGDKGDQIPSQVRKLKIKGDYSASRLVPGCFPDTLTELDFGMYSPNSKLLSGIFPKSIRKLSLGYFNRKIEIGGIPEQVEYLDLGPKFNQVILPRVIPQNIKTIIFDQEFEHRLTPDLIPINVENFHCPYGPVIEIGMLSNLTKLKTIRFLSELNGIECGALPSSLTRLEFTEKIDFPIEANVLPICLKDLLFFKGIGSDNPTQPLKTLVLPCSIEYLSISFTKYKPRPLPPLFFTNLVHLKHLKIKISSEQYCPVEFNQLPRNLEKFTIGNYTSTVYNLLEKNLELINFLITSSQFTKPQIQVEIFKKLRLLSIEKSDPFIYYTDFTSMFEGFLRKDTILTNLKKLINKSI